MRGKSSKIRAYPLPTGGPRGFRQAAAVRFVSPDTKKETPEPMVRFKLSDRKTGEQILPAFYEDNYFALQGGEKKTLTVKYLPEMGYEPVVTLEQLR